jgi:hypothetical protein
LSHVERVEVFWREATGEFNRFTLQY